MAYTLKPLPYPANALEPHYDEATVKIHHGKHHQTYVDNLNKFLEGHPDLQAMSLDELLKNLPKVPQDIRQKVTNNAGGVWNHDFFWAGMGPAGKEGTGGKPRGAVAEAIQAAFGSFKEFQAKFKESALAQFGSGWAYLVRNDAGALEIRNFANQDCPVSVGVTPLLTIDVWEHAYYLKFQNRRPEWVDAWWNVVAWDGVAERFEA
jgi:Fe-Mn family superoxide dismutase